MQIQKSFKEEKASGRLYLVPTPIGNLEDMTMRALRTLKEVTLIASEDTRMTKKLLNYFEIETPQISLHEHNVHERVPQLVEKLRAGQSLAQVSDAGMPSISDPGHELVVACIEEGIQVVSLPGATAGVTALIASGLPAEQFTFIGFLPRKKRGQVERLEGLKNHEATLLFYESPYRVKTTVGTIAEVFGAERQVVVCRELTKIHEEYIRGSAGEVQNYLNEHEVKGEICLLVAGQVAHEEAESEAEWQQWTVEEHLEKVINTGLSSKEAIKEVAKIRHLKKQEVYKLYHT